MRHYDITQWADFVRGHVEPTGHAAMAEHLSESCGKCQATATLLKKTVTVAGDEAHYEVPDYVVHCAKAISVLQFPETVHILSGTRSRMVFDSFREPLPAGVRSQQRISRQTLYEAGDYSLDLRQENERGSRQVTLVGQIANRKQPGLPVVDVPVYLLSGKSVVARAVSNEFGEFQMAYVPRTHLQLYAPVDTLDRHPTSPSGRKRSSERTSGGATQ